MQLQKAHNIIHSDSRLAYYQLRQLRTIARSLSDDAAKMLVSPGVHLLQTTVLLFRAASPTVWSSACSWYKMRQLSWSLEPVDESTSCRC